MNLTLKSHLNFLVLCIFPGSWSYESRFGKIFIPVIPPLPIHPTNRQPPNGLAMPVALHEE